MRWLLAALLAPAAASATDLVHQGRLLTTAGVPLNAVETVVVTFYADAAGSTTLGAVSVPNTPIQDGYYAVRLTGLDAAWFEQDLWLRVGTSSAPLTPIQPLTSVGRASFADRAGGVPVSTVAVTGPCTDEGALRWDATLDALVACDGASWRAVTEPAVPLELQTDGHRTWRDGTYAASCEAYRRPTPPYVYDGDTGTGTYWIDPDGAGGTAAFVVLCEQDVHDGGWTRFLALTTSGAFQSIQGVPNTTESVVNSTWTWSKRMFYDSQREVLVREAVAPFRTHRYILNDATISNEAFVGMLTGDENGVVDVYNPQTDSYVTMSDAACNTNNHSQWNCDPVNGVRFHYGTRDWRGDGGASYSDWIFTGYQNCCSTNYAPYVENWNGVYNQTAHNLYVR